MARLCTNSEIDTISNCHNQFADTSFAYRFQVCHHYRHHPGSECFLKCRSKSKRQEVTIVAQQAFPAQRKTKSIFREFHEPLDIHKVYFQEFPLEMPSGEFVVRIEIVRLHLLVAARFIFERQLMLHSSSLILAGARHRMKEDKQLA